MKGREGKGLTTNGIRLSLTPPTSSIVSANYRVLVIMTATSTGQQSSCLDRFRSRESCPHLPPSQQFSSSARHGLHDDSGLEPHEDGDVPQESEDNTHLCIVPFLLLRVFSVFFSRCFSLLAPIHPDLVQDGLASPWVSHLACPTWPVNSRLRGREHDQAPPVSKK